MAGAVVGIYGNSKEEAIYPFYANDKAQMEICPSLHRLALHIKLL